MTVLIFQGGDEIQKNDLESHLSSLCQLENVGVLLGAGSSKAAGGKVMKQVWQDFKGANPLSVSFLRDECKLITQPEIDNDSVNVELLIDQVVKFIEVSTIRKDDVTNLEQVRNQLYRSVTSAALLVADKFPKQAIGKLDCLSHHRNLLEKLISNRQPGQSAPAIFTTNYDLAIEWAAEEVGIQVVNGFVGTHTRTFQPHTFDLGFRNVNAQGEARFGHYNLYLYKLHGSLTWMQDKDGSITELPSSLAYQQAIQPLIDHGAFSSNQHLIYPGANKYHHTIGYVYGEMFRRFSEFLGKPQTALFVNGYGFGDYHINRIILGALLNPSLHIVIYYPELETLKGVDPSEFNEAQKCIDKIKKMKISQITIIGGVDAYFNAFVDMIPKPVLFPKNNTAKILADAIRDLAPSKDDFE